MQGGKSSRQHQKTTHAGATGGTGGRVAANDLFNRDRPVYAVGYTIDQAGKSVRKKSGRGVPVGGR